MRYFGIFFAIVICIVGLSVIAQTSDKASLSASTEKVVAQPNTTPETSERTYPIAAGIWYPGNPLPEKPFRYYRIRCWPGCHHGGSPYAKYPDLPETAEAETMIESTKTPWVYPIAAGVWYPGDPLPEKPFRYYRVRCWPGCHSYGEYADPRNMKKSSEKQTTSY